MTQAAVSAETIVDVMKEVAQIGKEAKQASRELAKSSNETRNAALKAAAQALRDHQQDILDANAKDMKAANEKGISGAFLDRLELNNERVESMAKGLEAIAELDDPLGKTLAEWSRDENGLHIKRVTVPLGVIGVIFESRPNVTADAAALCLKSGNAAVLRGGSESFHSSGAIMQALQSGIEKAGLPKASVQNIPTTDREAVGAMLRSVEFIDVIVPRGGKGLIKRVMEDSLIPTLQHLDGNCHSYVHSSADADKAVRIVENAKMRRTGICGATESIVIDEAVAGSILPQLVDALAKKGCEVRGDEEACMIDGRINEATEEDFDTEYLDAIVSVKVVSGLDEAIAHVQAHSSGHTDCIIAEDQQAVERFQQEIDSAIIMHNTSTQFADGGEFGMGAEIGIATGKLHARGPVGIEQLTTFKYIVSSECSVRQ